MTTTLEQALHARVGHLIQSRTGQVFRVDKVKQVNYLVMDEDGKQWNLRKTGAYKVDQDIAFAGPAAPERKVREIPIPDPSERLIVGNVVEFKSGKFADGNKYVVLRDNGTTCSVVKLGGDNGRYVRGVGYSHLRKTTAV